MPVRIEVTYDMAKALGTERLEVEAGTVADAVAAIRERFAGTGADFEVLTGRTALAVNGVLVRYRERLRTKLADGDTLAFVKAASGG
jgi:molybdopterin converting factor small subunit